MAVNTIVNSPFTNHVTDDLSASNGRKHREHFRLMLKNVLKVWLYEYTVRTISLVLRQCLYKFSLH